VLNLAFCCEVHNKAIATDRMERSNICRAQIAGFGYVRCITIYFFSWQAMIKCLSISGYYRRIKDIIYNYIGLDTLAVSTYCLLVFTDNSIFVGAKDIFHFHILK
ncbi:hypothetical protein ACJX0J_041038, partial [Zea mays]